MKKRSGKRWLAFLMCLCLMGAMTPVSVKAEGDLTTPVGGKGLGISIMADPTAPANTTDAWRGSYVYLGTYNGNPVKYRVLDRTTTDFGGTTMLLDCDSILWQGDNPSSKFDDSTNVWSSSYIKQYLNSEGSYGSSGFLTGSFTSSEQNAIAASSKASASTTDGDGYSMLNYAALSGEKIFLLDAKEATNTGYGYSNTDISATNRKKSADSAYWWLRSADSLHNDGAGCVDISNCLSGTCVNDINPGVSPALNVNLSSVLFSAVLSGTSGQPGAEYKLTLLDNGLTITPGSIARGSGDVVTVPYTIGGTNAGNATQVSLMVLDKEYTQGNTNGAKLVAYEKLADAGAAGGTFTLTSDMKNGSFYYYIVAEDVNGGNLTDYASTPVQISIPAIDYTITATAGANGSISPAGAVRVMAGDSRTFAISVDSGYVIDTLKVDGVAVTANGNSYTFGSVNADHTIEVTFKQEAGSAVAVYQILNGADSSWTSGSSAGLTIRGDGAFSKFTGVKVDGNLLDRSNYTAEEGSTIITLKADYLNTLSAGNHTVEILWTDGLAVTAFTINAKVSGDVTGTTNNNGTVSGENIGNAVSPKTGDMAQGMWLPVLMLGIGMVLILAGWIDKKKLNILRK